ncbi:MAG TPA: DUF5916 domain-containing protein [Gemmatimonadaceae bacterium]|nr:DUF5916 domain-containing protein [Gemmatimonadaceae bacterium]
MLSLLFQLAVSTPAQPPLVYNGRAGQTAVAIPRLDDTIAVDGLLTEPAWRRAALLTGFSVYQPVDNQPSPDSTEVLVWYSRDAIHFGIRAFEPHAPVNSSLADRDHIGADDNVEIHLDTFGERNRALVFIVNPLGVQADGTKSEGGGFIPGSNVMPGQNDLSADFQWQSKGHVTEWGYEVEIRIPFRSIRYATGDPQDWGLQINRHAQHNGYEETWTPAVRANASFISQAGWLRGMSGMRHGQVIEITPELTNTTVGAPAATAGDWRYTNSPKLGGNIRWTLGSNFVLNGTVKPDFSQVEADAAQIAADQRFALFYAEKRPFFVESSDQFNVPNTLVYTRRIVQPDAALKLTGKLGAMDVAVLSALDAGSTTIGGDKPLVDILRLRRAIRGESSVGLLYSDRLSDARNNHVMGFDTRLLFKRLYFFQGQATGSMTYDPGDGAARRVSPMWQALVDRTGRKFGFNYSIIGIDSGFRADNGFVQRTGIVQPAFRNRFTLYGRRGELFERYNTFVSFVGVWRYADFLAAKSMLENQASMNNSVTLRGGWQISATPTLSSYAFDQASYASYRTQSPIDIFPPVYSPFVVPGRTPSFTMNLGVSTPQYPLFDANLSVIGGNDVDLIETSRIRRRGVNAGVNLRPTDRLRVTATYTSSSYTRRETGVQSFSSRIPRLKLEYQVARPLFIRVVSQYQATQRAALIDPTTGMPIAFAGASGTPVLSTSSSSNALRADWLFSYRPNPGTVVFVGYGNTLREPEALSFSDLRRSDDAFFVKLSYLFRVMR